jgi:hypothetical protein
MFVDQAPKLERSPAEPAPTRATPGSAASAPCAGPRSACRTRDRLVGAIRPSISRPFWAPEPPRAPAAPNGRPGPASRGLFSWEFEHPARDEEPSCPSDKLQNRPTSLPPRPTSLPPRAARLPPRPARLPRCPARLPSRSARLREGARGAPRRGRHRQRALARRARARGATRRNQRFRPRAEGSLFGRLAFFPCALTALRNSITARVWFGSTAKRSMSERSSPGKNTLPGACSW